MESLNFKVILNFALLEKPGGQFALVLVEIHLCYLSHDMRGPKKRARPSLTAMTTPAAWNAYPLASLSP